MYERTEVTRIFYAQGMCRVAISAAALLGRSAHGLCKQAACPGNADKRGTGKINSDKGNTNVYKDSTNAYPCQALTGGASFSNTYPDATCLERR